MHDGIYVIVGSFGHSCFFRDFVPALPTEATCEQTAERARAFLDRYSLLEANTRLGLTVSFLLYYWSEHPFHESPVIRFSKTERRDSDAVSAATNYWFHKASDVAFHQHALDRVLAGETVLHTTRRTSTGRVREYLTEETARINLSKAVAQYEQDMSKLREFLSLFDKESFAAEISARALLKAVEYHQASMERQRVAREASAKTGLRRKVAGTLGGRP